MVYVRSFFYAVFILVPLLVFASFASQAQEESVHTSMHKMFQSMTNRLGDCFSSDVVITAHGRNSAQTQGARSTGQTPDFEAECDSSVRVIARMNVGGQEVVQDGQTFMKDFIRPSRSVDQMSQEIRERVGRELTIYDTGFRESEAFQTFIPVPISGNYSLVLGLFESDCGGWRYIVNGVHYVGEPRESDGFVTINFEAQAPVTWIGYLPAEDCFMEYFSVELFKL